MANKKVTAKSGQTLSQIAKANQTTVQAIKQANPKLTTDPKYKGGNVIFSGTTLKLPGTPKPPKSDTLTSTTLPIPITEEPITETGLTQEDLDKAIAEAIAGVSGQYNDQIRALMAQIQGLQGQGTSQQLLQQMLLQQQLAQEQATAQAVAAETQRRENAISVLTTRFNQYNLGTLIPKIRDLAINGATEATITLQLMETPEYKERFRANQDRIKKGLTVLDPGEYLSLEDKYRQILRAYGLNQFDNDAYVTQFISNDVSAAELSSRVEVAVQRVRNADPAVLNTLTRFYGIAANDLVGYVLDPEQEFAKIERKVAAAEIGAAAGLQGIQPGVAVAEQLAAQGITKAQAQKGYATIADILPTSEKLSQIYTGVLDQYGLAEAEQEVFNSLASAQRKRRALTEREIASFSGASGLGKTSLTSQTGGTF